MKVSVSAASNSVAIAGEGGEAVPETPSFLLLEDGVSFLLQEDGTSKFLQE